MTSDLLQKVGTIQEESEFYTPIPKGYEVGKTKYVVIFGTVMSGLGKGIFSSSLAKLLQDKGMNVSAIKFEGYLNVDSGTLNPFRHGEVFVLDDGMETDMDLGTYERMLGHNLSKDNFATNGQLLNRVLERERRGDYLGRDVQIIPHFTGEIKLKLRELALKSKADVIFVEIGGTVGDFENSFYIEAMRELAFEEGKHNVCFTALTFIIESEILGEQKSKAAQLGVRRLMEVGIQPDIVVCRAKNPVTTKIKQKISVFTNVPTTRVVSMHDKESIYLVPTLLQEQGVDSEVVNVLGLGKKVNSALEKKNQKIWQNFVDKIQKPKKTLTIGITGKYTGVRDSYASILRALEHAATSLDARISVKWIETTGIEDGSHTVEAELSGVDGIIVPGGFGKRGVEGKIQCVRYAREHGIPYLGLCYGFQVAVIEFARNVCGLKKAHTTEVDPTTAIPVIDILPEQKKLEGLGGNMRLGGQDMKVMKGTKAYELYGKKEIVRERFRHRYEVNPQYIKALESKGMIFSGRSPKFPIMQILELPSHPFFVGTQYHAEFTSRPLAPNPLFVGFMKACAGKK